MKDVPGLGETSFPAPSLGLVAEVRLGKMLQTAAGKTSDVQVPYLRAGSLSTICDGVVKSPQMWASRDDIAAYSVRPGDLIVAEGGDVGRAEFVPELGERHIIQNSLHRVRTRTGDIRFLRYALEAIRGSGWLAELCNRSTFGHLTADKISSLRLPWPSVPEQKMISDFLDTETARIDALIAKKRRLIDRFHERTRSRLVELVLGDRGQDGTRSPSGIYRLVPQDWGETSLRHLGCEVQTGPFGSQLHAEEYVEGGWPVVNPMNLVDGGITAVDTMTVSDEKRLDLARHILRVGDIIFGRRGEMGRAGLVSDRHVGWLCGTGSLRLRVTGSRIAPSYLVLLLGTSPARAYFQLASVGSTMDNLNSEIVLAFPTLVPPRAEQEHIAQEVRSLLRADEVMRERLDTQIDLLTEHRQALVTAAVTGELAVPGMAA